MNTGRTKPYFFAFDSKSTPGKMLCHCVRFETQIFPIDDLVDQTSFTILGADHEMDPRIRHMLIAAYKSVKNNPHLFPERDR